MSGERRWCKVRTARANQLSDHPADDDESLCDSIDPSGRTVLGADLIPFRKYAETLV